MLVKYGHFLRLWSFEETAAFAHPLPCPTRPLCARSPQSNNAITFALSHFPPAKDASTSGGKLAACAAHSLAHASQGLAGISH